MSKNLWKDRWDEFKIYIQSTKIIKELYNTLPQNLYQTE